MEPNDQAGAPAPLAEYVRYAASGGRVPLAALLWSPPPRTNRAALWVPGFYGSFAAGGPDYAPLVRRLTAHGVAFMAINLRTASDFTDPRIADAVDDVGAAVDELARRGFTELALLGTSLGAPRATMYLAATQARAVRALGLVAPIVSPWHEARWRFDEADRTRHDALLAQCRALVAADRAREVVVFERWFPGLTVRMTARGFLGTFGAPGDTDVAIPPRGARVRVPVAIFQGGDDVVALPPNGPAILESLTAAPARELVRVDGGTHTLEPGRSAQAYADAIGDWIATVLPAA